MNIPLTRVAATAAFLLAEANGERSRALLEIPADTPDMMPGTILAADGTAAASPEEAFAVLYGPVFERDTAQKATGIVRDAEVHGELLQWPANTTDATKAAYAERLAALGIVVRWTERPTGLETDATLADDLPAGGEDPEA
jgi:hypothetical protein